VFDLINGMVSTTILPNNGTIYGRFTADNLNQDAYIYVFAEGMEYSAEEDPPQIFYKLCNEADANDCVLTDAERNGEGMQSAGYRIS
jgi:hypothetical protein